MKLQLGILVRLLVVFTIVFLVLSLLKRILPIAGIGLGLIKAAVFIALILALLLWWKSVTRR